MYFNIESYDDLKKLEGGALDSMKKNNCIIFLRMNGCPHCDHMKSEWNSMVREKRDDPNLDILEIERNRMDDLMMRDREFFMPKFMGIRGFPSIMLHNRMNQLIPFQDERKKGNFLKFIKIHSKPVKVMMKKPDAVKKSPTTKTTAKSSTKTSKPKSKTTEGLDNNGKLKKGYRYNKNGKIVKAKKEEKKS